MKLNYIIIPLITILTAALGSYLTSSSINSGWYDAIKKPAWTPPGSLIGTIWTIIFILATISALIVWNKMPHDSRLRWIAAIFLLNAILNVGWSYIFFTLHLTGLAVFEAVLLGLSVVTLITLIWPADKIASLLLVPYALWVLFATFLTYTVWSLNAGF